LRTLTLERNRHAYAEIAEEIGNTEIDEAEVKKYAKVFWARINELAGACAVMTLAGCLLTPLRQITSVCSSASRTARPRS